MVWVRIDNISNSSIKNCSLVDFQFLPKFTKYRVSHQYVDNLGLNFAILKTTYWKK